MITRHQIKRLVIEHNRWGNITMSALKSGMTRKTAAKHLKLKEPCHPPRVNHDWPTHKDGFSEVWPEVDEMLKAAPELEGKLLFEHLQTKYPGQFSDGKLRTFQRRIKNWKCLQGPEKEIFFEQITIPGDVVQTDWTHMNKLGITIGGEAYPHLLCHSVMPHSNWEWATRCSSESILSARNGIQAALLRLGGVPKIWQIDNSTAATHQLYRDGRERKFNDDFVAIAEHFGMTPRTTNVACPNENGDVESLNGHLKRRIKQHLLLRGHCDFESLQAYDLFLVEVLNKANAGRCEKVSEELNVMRELPSNALPDYEELYVTVGWASTIRIKQVTYSVSSRLIGTKVKVQVGEVHIKVYCGTKEVAVLPRQYGKKDDSAGINFRHVIRSLVRKPGAFTNWKHRDALFPSVTYRRAYDQLVENHGLRRGDRDYLHLLQLAADTSQTEVEETLEKNINATLSLDMVRRELPSRSLIPTDIAPPIVILSDYDDLLEEFSSKEVLHAN